MIAKKLFIAFKKGFSDEIKPATISSWLKSVIIMAYKECRPETLKTLNDSPSGQEHCCLVGTVRWGLGRGDHVGLSLSWQNTEGFSLGPIIAAQN